MEKESEGERGGRREKGRKRDGKDSERERERTVLEVKFCY